jgi:hypothetical protein
MASLRSKREEILSSAKRHGACNIRVFGSVARGEAAENSDLDLLVSTTDHTSPWCPAGLVVGLESLRGSRVQVVTEEGRYWLLRREILREGISL